LKPYWQSKKEDNGLLEMTELVFFCLIVSFSVIE